MRATQLITTQSPVMTSNMVPATQWMTAAFCVFLSAVLSLPINLDDDTWMAMLEPGQRPEISWCPSVIVAAHWILSDQECAISEALELTAVAGVREWEDRERGQERVGDAVLRTPFGRMRGVHLIMAFEFNENVSFVRLADGELPHHGLPCRASGSTHPEAAPGGKRPRRLVSQTVLAMPAALCTAFGLGETATCARSYPRHFPCGAPPPVWLVCRRLLVGWCYYSRPCSDAYQTHPAHAIHSTIAWLQSKIPDLPEPEHLGRATPGAHAVSLFSLLPCLITATAVCNNG